MPDQTLDLRGLTCPLPVLRAKKVLDTLTSGTVLTVIASDPAATRDFATLCRQIDATLLTSTEERGEFRFEIRKD